MEYKYFTEEPEGYVLKKPMLRFYFYAIVCAVIGIVSIYYAIKNGGTGGYWGAFVCAIFMTIFIVGLRYQKTTIQLSQRMVIAKAVFRHKEYSFDNFLNFKITTIRHGLISQKYPSMYFDDNGRNRIIPLGVTFSKKKAEKIIAEAGKLMGKS